MEILQSKIKSEGIAFGTAFVVENDEIRKHASTLIGEEGQAKFKEAMAKVEKDLTKAAEKNEVFAAHLEMLHDPMLEENVIENIKEGADVNSAIRIAEGRITYMFGDIDDDYLKSRLDDVKDVIDRLLAFIDGRDQVNPYDNLPEGSIIVAHNLAPSDTTKMDIGKVVGFVTDLGSLTTHVGIFARYNGIIAVVGINKCEKKIKNGDELILDGGRGLVIINSDDQTLMEYRREAKLEEEDNNAQLPTTPLEYKDRQISVFGNAGNLNEVRNVIMSGADGVGLFRSEFLYMQTSTMPDEDIQNRAYSEAVQICSGKPLTIRLLDIGGDKGLPYMQLPKEDNPFLGIRGIRLTLRNKDIFKTQVRAILRASALGEIRIMLPMVSMTSEITDAKNLIKECMCELEKEDVSFDKNIKIGIMIETPATVLCAEEFAKLVDFFSIGTNDLTQYIMSADRGNAEMSYLCFAEQPAVQKAIKMSIDAAHKVGIPIGMCGEHASLSSATETLLKYGLDFFSVAPPSIHKIKKNIRNCK